MTITLQAKTREERGKKLAGLRKQGKVPGVVYGPKEESTAITLERSEFEKVLKAAGESTIIDLKGLDEEKEVLIHDVEYDTLTGVPAHADLYAIERGKKLTVNVPLIFEGEAPAEKAGTIGKVMHEIEVESLPRDLPHDIKVDLTTLKEIGDHILVKDLPMPKNVVPTAEPEVTVVIVSEQREEEPEEVAEVDMDAIEVEQKGKGEEGEGGGEAPAEGGGDGGGD